MHSYKGRYKVKNPNKYKGDSSNVIYRSSFELKFMNYLDLHQDVLEWSSEEVIVPYLCPTDNRKHRYFVDFWVKKKNKEGNSEVLLVEIKPLSQTKEPTKKKKKSRRYIQEVFTWAKNDAKWKAAIEYCRKRNWKFRIITDKDLK